MSETLPPCVRRLTQNRTRVRLNPSRTWVACMCRPRRNSPRTQLCRTVGLSRKRTGDWQLGNQHFEGFQAKVVGFLGRRSQRKSSVPLCTSGENVAETQFERDNQDNKDVEMEEPTISGEEGLDPLRDALESASEMALKSTFKREALEAEAQRVGELAVEAREAFDRCKNKVEEAMKEKDESQKEKEQLEETLKQLKAEKLEIEQTKRKEEQQAGVDGEEAVVLLEGGTILSSAEWISEYDDDIDEEGVASSIRATADLNEELKKLKLEIAVAQGRMTELEEGIKSCGPKIIELKEKADTAEIEARAFENRAAAVMTAAQVAVTVELEAKAVVKETQAALDKAVQDFVALEASQELDAEEEFVTEVVVEEDSVEVFSDTKKAAVEVEGNGAVSMPHVEVPKAAPAPPSEKKEKKRDTASEKAPMLQPIKSFLNKHGVTMSAVILCAAAAVLFYQTPAGKQFVSAAGGFLNDVTALAGKTWRYIIPSSHVGEEGFLQTIWLLLMSVVMVPLVCKGIPGGTPVLGFLIAGAVVGPNALGIVRDMEGVKLLGELGVVFLLFNIGLELSLERLRSMAKLVFGLGSAQTLVTIAAVALTTCILKGLSGPAAIVVGCALALSSTAVGMQVLQDRGESGSRHGRASFSVLLLQDLAVVVVLMMIPLLAPKNGAMSGGLKPILQALGTAAVKAAICITGIIVGGRVLLRPIYRIIAGFENKEIFAALTLLVVLGASKLTEVSGLSLALGAFLAGLLLAETEYVLQVESDIAPYKGLLMGLFFMTVGMEISIGPMIAQWRSLLLSVVMLLVGKIAIMAAVGPIFGLSQVTAIRSGLLLASGGEFAFVTAGEAELQGILPASLVNQLFLSVALSMALLPYLATVGARIGQLFEKSDMRALQPRDVETGDLQGHVIIAGFGRIGSLIARLLSERMISFVALDVQSDRVQRGKGLDLPVYFGDAGSQAVLQSVGAKNAACIVVALDSPGANYRCVWAASRYFPHVPVYVRARDVDHARNLEKAGASVVVPETIEPSLQLAASVLSQTDVSPEEVGVIIDTYRRTHLAELETLAEETGYSLGYGFPKPSYEDNSLEEEDDDLETESLGTATVPEAA